MAKGFTLVESLISYFLLAFITLCIGQFYVKQTQFLEKFRERYSAEENLLNAKELLNACSNTTGPHLHAIESLLPNSEPFQFKIQCAGVLPTDCLLTLSKEGSIIFTLSVER